MASPRGVLPTCWFVRISGANLSQFLASGLDLFIVAVPLTLQTRGMLGRAQFRVLAEAAEKTELKVISYFIRP
ncbi:hypothetical protein DL764_008431 [Monosporascus ibericus]|uniref:Uncharacterized protein n=1 Tax=Monosporascus ibericus TaxID=155417 RepID=A0A4Q4T0A6_9PEZI|nr:hypothetical protein DL764_008431 [Monosporascus ibericus]